MNRMRPHLPENLNVGHVLGSIYVEISVKAWLELKKNCLKPRRE